MGPSLGGMVVLAYAAQFPGAARRLACISGTAAAAPFAIALRSIQREAITHDPAGRGATSPSERAPVTGQRLARKLGTVTYRSAAEWAQRFGRQPIRQEVKHGDPFASEFAIQGYLEALAQRFVSVFDPNCYLYISRSMDRFDLSAHGEPVSLFRRAGLSAALVIGVQSDLLFSLTDRKSTRLNSSHSQISYAVFCLKKKKFDASLISPSLTYSAAVTEYATPVDASFI